MTVVERLVRPGLHAVIDCLGLISQGGDSDGPICHCAGVKTDGWPMIICCLERNIVLPASFFFLSLSQNPLSRLYYTGINGVVAVVAEQCAIPEWGGLNMSFLNQPDKPAVICMDCFELTESLSFANQRGKSQSRDY